MRGQPRCTRPPTSPADCPTHLCAPSIPWCPGAGWLAPARRPVGTTFQHPRPGPAGYGARRWTTGQQTSGARPLRWLWRRPEPSRSQEPGCMCCGAAAVLAPLGALESACNSRHLSRSSSRSWRNACVAAVAVTDRPRITLAYKLALPGAWWAWCACDCCSSAVDEAVQAVYYIILCTAHQNINKRAHCRWYSVDGSLHAVHASCLTHPPPHFQQLSTTAAVIGGLFILAAAHAPARTAGSRASGRTSASSCRWASPP